MQILSALGGGLWIIPTILLLGAIFSAYRAYQQRNTKSSIVKVGAFWYAVILFAVTIIVFIIMQNEK